MKSIGTLFTLTSERLDTFFQIDMDLHYDGSFQSTLIKTRISSTTNRLFLIRQRCRPRDIRRNPRRHSSHRSLGLDSNKSIAFPINKSLSYMDQLPQELIDHIFDYLNPQGLKSVRLTSRQFWHPATRKLYGHILCIDDRSSGLRDKIEGLPWYLVTSSTLAN